MYDSIGQYRIQISYYVLRYQLWTDDTINHYSCIQSIIKFASALF